MHFRLRSKRTGWPQGCASRAPDSDDMAMLVQPEDLANNRTGSAPDRPILEVTVPVYNEEADLAFGVRRLHAHLSRSFPYPFLISIADNASTDRTGEVAEQLTR